MMRKILGFITILIFSLSTYGQNGAKIEFKEETINYGEVTKGEDDGVRVFKFTNTGDAPLIISNVKSSCGCTVPSKPKEPILPGQNGEISVKYNMKTGPISKTITVESNATNKPSGTIPLRIKGNVVVKEVISPLQKKKTFPNQ